MNLKNFERVELLNKELAEARRTLAAFKKPISDNVFCFAVAQDSSYGRTTVAIPSIPRAAAVEAAQHEVDKIIRQLSELGVTVED